MRNSRQLRLDGTLREDAVERAIVETLERSGYVVLRTSAKKQKGASGVDRGVPDLLVAKYVPAAFKGKGAAWLGLEVKSKDAAGKWKYSCCEQYNLHRLGLTIIVCSEWQALAAVQSFFGDPVTGWNKAPEPVDEVQGQALTLGAIKRGRIG